MVILFWIAVFMSVGVVSAAIFSFSRCRPRPRDWKGWYAWYPVTTLRGEHIWLQRIERRWSYYEDLSVYVRGYAWRYRTLFDKLAEP